MNYYSYNPFRCNSSTTRFRASNRSIPAYKPQFEVIIPRSEITRVHSHDVVDQNQNHQNHDME